MELSPIVPGIAFDVPLLGSHGGFWRLSHHCFTKLFWYNMTKLGKLEDMQAQHHPDQTKRYRLPLHMKSSTHMQPHVMDNGPPI